MATMRSASVKSQTVMTNRKVVPSLTQVARTLPVVQSRGMVSASTETDAQFDARYIEYFNRADIDGWELRKGMSDLISMDLVPEPSVVGAALRACRRINDFSLTTRILEVIRVKCGDKEATIWPYMVQELKPVLDELGISLPRDLGYEQPELALPNPYNIH